MTRIANWRVSTGEKSIAAQRQALGGTFDQEFEYIGINGTSRAEYPPGFSKLLSYIRQGDKLFIYAIDRIGRDALDVQTNVRRLLQLGVNIDVHSLGIIERSVGELIVAVLAQIAEMKRQRIGDRFEAGRDAEKAALAATGRNSPRQGQPWPSKGR